MIVTLTGIFYYHLEHSLDNFKVTFHKNKEEAVEFIYEEAKKYLKNCTCVCDGKKKCVNCPKEQLKELLVTIRCLYKCENYDDYDQNDAYSDDFSEFHHKIIN